MAFTEFSPLDEKSSIEYIKAMPSLYSKFGNDLKAKEARDGNDLKALGLRLERALGLNIGQIEGWVCVWA